MLRTVSESQERTRRIPAKALYFQNSCFLHLLRGSPRATSGKPGQRRERECSPRCLGPRPLVSSNSTGKGSWVRIPPPALNSCDCLSRSSFWQFPYSYALFWSSQTIREE